MTDFLQNIKENTYFKGSVITIIILSALLLGTSTYDMNDQAEKVLIFYGWRGSLVGGRLSIGAYLGWCA